jgi:hypothetical protein
MVIFVLRKNKLLYEKWCEHIVKWQAVLDFTAHVQDHLDAISKKETLYAVIHDDHAIVAQIAGKLLEILFALSESTDYAGATVQYVEQEPERAEVD